MERAKYLFVILFSLVTCISLAQNNVRIYKAFISGNMADWKKEIDSIAQKQLNNDDKLELVNSQIGYVGWCVGNKKYEEAKQYIQLAESHLKELNDAKFKPSYVQSYKGAISGLKIGINPFSAIFLGPGIVSKAKKAVELDKENPNAYILLGNSKYYMWAMLGGSKTEALKYYKQAEQIIEKDTLNITKNWKYLSLLTMIAHTYEEMENYPKANKYYQKVLRLEPNYQWIKDEIYPQFLRTYEKE